MIVKSRSFGGLKFPTIGRHSDALLERYFPKGTVYFYGYPSGTESGFLNKVPPSVEELVSIRPLMCSGKDLTVIAFANPAQEHLLKRIADQPKFDDIHKKPLKTLPAHIDLSYEGSRRNEAVKKALKDMVRPGTLIMAQPFLDDDLSYLYQISPKLTNWLNDKHHMTDIVPANLLPKRYAEFKKGSDFADSKTKVSIPCVVKVSSSSSGDGVYICYDQKHFEEVKAELKNTNSTVIIEQYIDATANYGVQFGIPADPTKPIDIIGVNRQLTTADGEFIGGIIDLNRDYHELAEVRRALLLEILPEVRKLGWHGIGCFDVLTDKDGHCYLIDANFRMTGMSAYLGLVAKNHITSSLASFGAEFIGGLEDLETILDSVKTDSGERAIRIIALTEHDGVCRFNGALLFDDLSKLPDLAKKLLDAGAVSKALEQLSKTA